MNLAQLTQQLQILDEMLNHFYLDPELSQDYINIILYPNGSGSINQHFQSGNISLVEFENQAEMIAGLQELLNMSPDAIKKHREWANERI